MMAQHTEKVCLGFLALVPGEDVRLVGPFRDRLHELGCVEGKNLTLDYRSAEGRRARLAALAAELASSHQQSNDLTAS